MTVEYHRDEGAIRILSTLTEQMSINTQNLSNLLSDFDAKVHDAINGKGSNTGVWTSAVNSNIAIYNGRASIGPAGTSPHSEAVLHIYDTLWSNTSTEDIGDASNELVLENDGDCGMTIRSAANSDAVISFARTGTGNHNVGQIVYSHASDSMTFRTANLSALTIDSQGHVTSNHHAIGTKLAVGVAGVHASFGFYNQTNAYFNGQTEINDVLIVSGSSAEIRVGTGFRIVDDDTTAAGRLAFNRNPENGTALSSNSHQRFQINGPGTAGDYLQFQNYDSNGTYIGGFHLSGGKYGFGHDAPNGILHIGTNTNSDVDVGSQSAPAIQLGGTNNYRLGMYTDGETAYIENKNGDNGIAFITKSSTEVMRVIKGGNHGAIQIGGTSNSGFMDFDSISLQLNTQRDPNTGTFVNTNRTHVGITLVGADSDGHIKFYTQSTNNATGAERLRINKNGNLYLMGSNDMRVKLGESGVGGESDSNNTVHVRGDNDHLILSAAGNGDIIFKENNNEHLRLKAGSGRIHHPSTTYNISYGHNNLSGATGNYNVAFGYEALHSVAGGYENVAAGRDAGRRINSGHHNVAIGHESLTKLTGGTACVAVGFQALESCEAHSNVGVGYKSGENIQTGTNNICIGKEAGTGSSPVNINGSTSNTICIGDNNMAAFYCAQTTINGSDKRDKTDITNFTNGLEFIKKMQPVTYKWDRRSWYLPRNEKGFVTDDDITKVTPDGSKKENKTEVGFIAQDVELLEKEIGFANDNTDRLFTNLTPDGNNYGMKYSTLVTVLVNAVKDLSTELDAAKSRIAALETR